MAGSKDSNGGSDISLRAKVSQDVRYAQSVCEPRQHRYAVVAEVSEQEANLHQHHGLSGSGLQPRLSRRLEICILLPANLFD